MQSLIKILKVRYGQSLAVYMAFQKLCLSAWADMLGRTWNPKDRTMGVVGTH